MKAKFAVRAAPVLVALALMLALPGLVSAQGPPSGYTIGGANPVDADGMLHTCWASGTRSVMDGGPFHGGEVWASDPGLLLERWGEPGRVVTFKGEAGRMGGEGIGNVPWGNTGAVFDHVDALDQAWYYSSLADIADGAFYAPYEQSLKYGTVMSGGSYNPLQGGASSSPWGSESEYIDRIRSTARLLGVDAGIAEVTVHWVGKGRESGGHNADPLVQSELNRSLSADLLASSQEQMIGGNRVITEQRQVPIANPTGRLEFNCSGGGSCSHSYTQDVEIVSIGARADAIDTNNAEYLNTTFERNQRNITGYDREGTIGHTFYDAQRPGYVNPSGLDPDNPYKGNFPDTDEDSIIVELILNDRFRKDFEHDLGWSVNSAWYQGRKEEKVLLSRFFEGEERLRVLEEMSIEDEDSPSNPKFPAPAFYAGDASWGRPAIRDLDDGMWGGDSVNLGWYDFTSEKRPAFAREANLASAGTGWSLDALVMRDSNYQPEHVGYRTSWLTSSRADSTMLDEPDVRHDGRMTPFKDAYVDPLPTGVEGDGYLGLYDDAEGVIQWPVNFSDVAWYLFDIQPDTSGEHAYAGDFDALTRHRSFGVVTAATGYAADSYPMYDFVVCEDHIWTAGTTGSARSEEPTCRVPDPLPGEPADPEAGQAVTGNVLSHKYLDDWHRRLSMMRGGDVAADADPKGVFPFEDRHGMAWRSTPAGRVPQDGRRLQSSWLVMQGVASPDDTTSKGVRTHSTVRFEIKDNAWFGADSALSRGEEGLIQYGFPPHFQDAGASPKTQAAGLRMMGRYERSDGVPDTGVLDPDQGYLLVVTFYQVKEDSNKGFHMIAFDAETSSVIAKTPGYQVRRVICRVWIPAASEVGAASAPKSLLQKIREKVGDAASSMFDALEGMLTSVLQIIYRGQFQLVRATSGAVCTGMQVMDSWAVGRDVENTFAARTDDEAVLLNPAVVADKQGIKDCGTLEAREVRVCDSSLGDINFRGRCRQLPKLKLGVTQMELYNPVAYEDDADTTDVDDLTFTEVIPVYDANAGAYGVPVRRDVVFHAIDEETVAYDTAARTRRVARWSDPYKAGLTELEIEWEVEDESVEEGLRDLVNGYVIEFVPDPRSMRYGVGLDDYIDVRVPRYTRYGECAGLGAGVSASDAPKIGEIVGVRLGALDAKARTEREVSHRLGSGACQDVGVETISHATVLRGVDGLTVNVHPPIPNVDSSEFLNAVVKAMPLAPTWEHTIRVRAYHGVPGAPGYREGPPSDQLSVFGNNAACLYQDRLPGGMDPAALEAEKEKINSLYGCTASQVQVGKAQAGDSLVSRVLSPVGSDICKDLFTATPGHLTWDNPVVRQLWTLMWVLSGLVLLALLLWQGVKMSYDMWVDPQPSVGLRELVPRMLLAVVLAASSLWICQVVLVLASDLTCFVAQATGTTMWSIVSSTVGDVMRIFQQWEYSLALDDEASLADVLMAWLKLIVVVFVILIFLIMFVIVFIKVCIMMLIRLVTLAALIVFAPLAFTLYASDSTAHWTRLWLKMFLGTTFVQAVVLIVLYMGINLMTTALSFGGVAAVSEEEKGLSDLIVGILIAFLTFGLADSVPKIINPAGQGLTDSVRGMGRMAVGGALLGAGAVAGLATGGASVVAQGGVAAARGAAGGWRGQQPDGGDPGAGGPSSPNPGLPVNPFGGLSSFSAPNSYGGNAPAGGANSVVGGGVAPAASGGQQQPGAVNIPAAAIQGIPGGANQPAGAGVAPGTAGAEGGTNVPPRSFGNRLRDAAVGGAAATPIVGGTMRGYERVRNTVRNPMGATSRAVSGSASAVGRAVDRLPSGPVDGARRGVARGRAMNSMIDGVMTGSILREQARRGSSQQGFPDADGVASPAEDPAEVRHAQMMALMASIANSPSQRAEQPVANPAAGPNYQRRNSGLFVPPA